VTLRSTIYARLAAHVGTAALVETRIYPNQLPENVTYPAVTYVAPVSDDDVEYRTHDTGQVPRSVARVQFNCYDTTGDGATALADQVVAAWSGYQDGCTVGYSFKANRISDGWQSGIAAYREIVDVMLEYAVI
jgi:hypothetical protein